MIGKFIVKDRRDAETFCICESDMNSNIKAKVFIPPLYRASVSSLSAGDEVFCVVDDSSGFGAILFKYNDGMTENNALKVSHDIDASGSIKAGGNCTVEGKFIGEGVVMMQDISQLFSAVQIVSPVGNCAIVPLSPMTIKFSGV